MSTAPASSTPSPASLPEPGLESELARAHGCPAGCPACAHAVRQIGVPALLADWEPFIRSDAALRLVQLCRRSNTPFPRLSGDDVVQFCIEEACFERLHYAEMLAQRQSAALTATTAPAELDDPEMQDAIGRARAFAAGEPR